VEGSRGSGSRDQYFPSIFPSESCALCAARSPTGACLRGSDLPKIREADVVIRDDEVCIASTGVRKKMAWDSSMLFFLSTVLICRLFNGSIISVLSQQHPNTNNKKVSDLSCTLEFTKLLPIVGFISHLRKTQGGRGVCGEGRSFSINHCLPT
jgi:hypothetical protein